MTATIYDLKTGTEYHVNDPKDCKDKTDLSAYQSAIMFSDIIKMGSILVIPDKVLLPPKEYMGKC